MRLGGAAAAGRPAEGWRWRAGWPVRLETCLRIYKLLFGVASAASLTPLRPRLCTRWRRHLADGAVADLLVGPDYVTRRPVTHENQEQHFGQRAGEHE